MYTSRDPQLGGFFDVLKKVRKTLHKYAPRELSPTRLLEKYQTDSARKANAKQAKVATDAANQIAQIGAQAKANLAAASSGVPSSGLASSATSAAGTSATNNLAPQSDNTILYVAAAGVGLVLLVALTKKKGRK